MQTITERQALEYEIGSSIWLTLLPHRWTYKYFARKTVRKHKRYIAFKAKTQAQDICY